MYFYCAGRDDSGANYEGFGPVTSRHQSESAALARLKNGGLVVGPDGRLYYARDGFWTTPEPGSPEHDEAQRLAFRKPGRPVTSGLGGDGNKPLKLRFSPEVRERIEAKGGAAWARQLILDALASQTP